MDNVMSNDGSVFDDWRSVFADWGDVSVSELHGLMTALVCAVKPPSANEWERLLFELSFSIPNDKALALLTQYAEDVSFELKDDDDAYEYAPLVPDDDRPLGERLFALKDWAGGFISGVGVADIHLNDEETQLLQDLAQIASMRLGDDVDGALGGNDTDHQNASQAHQKANDNKANDNKENDNNTDEQNKPQSDGDSEAQYLELYEFARLVPVSFAVRKKRAVNELAIIKGLAMGRKTASESDNK